jgi:hypothetical protein
MPIQYKRHQDDGFLTDMKPKNDVITTDGTVDDFHYLTPPTVFFFSSVEPSELTAAQHVHLYGDSTALIRLITGSLSLSHADHHHVPSSERVVLSQNYYSKPPMLHIASVAINTRFSGYNGWYRPVLAESFL